MMESRLGKLHPGVIFLYFTVILVTVAFCAHPILQILALMGAMFYCALILPGGAFWRMTIFYAVPAVLLALTNPIFSHRGNTPLFYVNRMPITRESLLCGVSLGLMLFCVLCWFRVMNTVMTKDRMLYLFGGALPKLSLLLSVTLRTVPLLRRKIQEIRQVQQGLGAYDSKRGYVHRLKCELQIFRTVLSAQAEDAIETGDCMRARGYGLSGRTTFREKHFTPKDLLALLILLFFAGILLAGLLGEALHIRFYPEVNIALEGLQTCLCGISFGILCFLPAAAEIFERIRWKWLLSRI